jgi:signal peptidase I
MRQVFGVAVAVTAAWGAVGCGNTTTNLTIAPKAIAPKAIAPKGIAPGSRSYRVPSQSMEPTLTIGQQVKVTPLTAEPTIGEIAVFHPPKEAQAEVCGPTPHVIRVGGAACAEPVPEPAGVKFIKRVVAAPGDEIYIREGHVFRRAPGEATFKQEADSYIKPCPARAAECNFPTPIRIPEGHWFMLGDNRGESDDSRFWGPVPTQWIAGEVQKLGG